MRQRHIIHMVREGRQQVTGWDVIVEGPHICPQYSHLGQYAI
jgi:hypothetical protein